jgi:hypothetical protein
LPDDVAQCCAQPRACIVDDAAAGDRQPEIKLAVALLVPAEMVGHRKIGHRPAWFERLSQIFRQALARPLLAALGDDVFEPRVPPVAAVTPIAMQAHHGCRRIEQMAGLDKGDLRREPGIGLRLVVGHAVTAAEQEVVPRETLFARAALEQRDNREIVGQDIDRVVLGDRETEFEFARQIALAVERIRLFLRRDLFTIDPDLVIGAGLRQQMRREPPRILFQPPVHGVADRRRHCRHRAHDIAAGRQARQQGLVDRRDRRLQPRFQHAVKLDALTRRDAQRAIGVTVGKIVQREVLVGGQAPARNADPHHELPVLLVAALLALGGAVAVIALIDAVKFEEAIPGLVERVRRVGEIARQIAAQMAALLLDRLGFRDCVERGHRGGSQSLSRRARWR